MAKQTSNESKETKPGKPVDQAQTTTPEAPKPTEKKPAPETVKVTYVDHGAKLIEKVANAKTRKELAAALKGTPLEYIAERISVDFEMVKTSVLGKLRLPCGESNAVIYSILQRLDALEKK